MAEKFKSGLKTRKSKPLLRQYENIRDFVISMNYTSHISYYKCLIPLNDHVQKNNVLS